MNNQKYWEERYKPNKLPISPSSFVDWVASKIDITFKRVIDFGCGNGRDTYGLASKGAYVLGIDYAIKNDEAPRAAFDKCDFKDMVKTFDCNFEIVYSRFFLHSISNEEIADLIKWTKFYFVAETRVEGDKPVLFTDHERNFVNEKFLIKTLEDNGFEIIKHKVGRGLAKYKNEDPLILRIIAKRKI